MAARHLLDAHSCINSPCNSNTAKGYIAATTASSLMTFFTNNSDNSKTNMAADANHTIASFAFKSQTPKANIDANEDHCDA